MLSGVQLEVASGEIACLLGASGSGKSTLLRIIAGLEPLQAGQITLHGQVIAEPGREPPPERRNFGLVFQDHVLFPHMSVAANVAFGLAHLSGAQAKSVVQTQLAKVGLDGFAERYPHTLSGGQQQRVALARALAPEPLVMLLDEPFASVDSTLRRQLREDTRQMLRASNVPSVIVTHDAEEAMEIADKILVIDEGTVIQAGTPAEVWAKPANRFVAELFAGTDAIAGCRTAAGVETAFGLLRLEDAPISVGSRCSVILQPSAVTLTPAAEGQVHVTDIRYLGDRWMLLIANAASDETCLLRVTTTEVPGFEVHQPVNVSFDPSRAQVFAL